MELTPQELSGVWLGVSHQTITVTSLSVDGTFSGTYFTPQVGVKTTFSGTWKMEASELTMIYTEADSFIKPPMEDRNQLEVLSKDAVILQTLPQGTALRWNRIHFGEENPLTPPTPNLLPPPSEETLAAITADDLCDSNPLFEWIANVIENSKGDSHESRELQAISSIPDPAGDYWIIFALEGIWGNGGMQSIVLDHLEEYVPRFLERAKEAYFRCGVDFCLSVC